MRCADERGSPVRRTICASVSRPGPSKASSTSETRSMTALGWWIRRVLDGHGHEAPPCDWCMPQAYAY